jgi:hypothetical protein
MKLVATHSSSATFFKGMDQVAMTGLARSMNTTKNSALTYAPGLYSNFCDSNQREQGHNAFIELPSGKDTDVLRILRMQKPIETQDIQALKQWKKTYRQELHKTTQFRSFFLNSASALSGFNAFLVWARIPFNEYCHAQMSSLGDLVVAAQQFRKCSRAFHSCVEAAVTSAAAELGKNVSEEEDYM